MELDSGNIWGRLSGIVSTKIWQVLACTGMMLRLEINGNANQRETGYSRYFILTCGISMPIFLPFCFVCGDRLELCWVTSRLNLEHHAVHRQLMQNMPIPYDNFVVIWRIYKPVVVSIDADSNRRWLTWKATKWSWYEAPKTNSAPASEHSMNPETRSPSHLNAAYPAGQRRTIIAKMNCRPIPHNTVRHLTYVIIRSCDKSSYRLHVYIQS